MVYKDKLHNMNMHENSIHACSSSNMDRNLNTYTVMPFNDEGVAYTVNYIKDLTSLLSVLLCSVLRDRAVESLYSIFVR